MLRHIGMAMATGGNRFLEGGSFKDVFNVEKIWICAHASMY